VLVKTTPSSEREKEERERVGERGWGERERERERESILKWGQEPSLIDYYIILFLLAYINHMGGFHCDNS
jgi:hypothetical protein